MMESIRGAGLEMLNGDRPLSAHSDKIALSSSSSDATETETEGDTGVYFDSAYRALCEIGAIELTRRRHTVLGRVMVTFSLRAMFVVQVLLLVVGPVTVFLPLGWVLYLLKTGKYVHYSCPCFGCLHRPYVT